MSNVLPIVIIVFVALFTAAQLRFALLLVIRPFLRPSAHAPVRSEKPMVAIQVATYREAPILSQLLDAIAKLEWPRERLQVQILDDSSGLDADKTKDIVDTFSKCGLRIDYLNRNTRAGFKAGALNYGLAAARDVALIAYFDADCRPRPNFLDELVPRLADPAAAAVQCRWEYPNALSSPLTALQAAAFEYLFHYEFEIRSRLDLPIYYLGSAAIWKREVLEKLGGWRETPFTAEDVDAGCRAAAHGWKVRYEPKVLADDDALEDPLVFRAQQRRWTKAVGQAGFDAIPSVVTAKSDVLAWAMDVTALLPHATIPITVITTILIALNVLTGTLASGCLLAALWIFLVLIIAPPAVLALNLAVRAFHPSDWLKRVGLMLLAGPAGTATMTSFLFGLADLFTRGQREFVATAKAGQTAMLRGDPRRWLFAFIGPIMFDVAVSTLFTASAAVAWHRSDMAPALATGFLGAVYSVSVVQSGLAFAAHWNRLKAQRSA
jgi:cellulose synthase/poly-beta-1,6-N-acetylglucosamine synthase-like glycosyltransferase